MMKKTPLTDFHVQLGARMQPFAGYNMPVEYSGINDEHINVRQNVGVFDVSHMGEFWVKGPDASRFLQYITTNDISRLTDGSVQYSCMPNGMGGIIDDLLVYRFDAETYLMVVNAANIEKDWQWCARHATGFGLEVGTDLYNASDEFALLAIQGPNALKVVQKLTDAPLGEMKYYTFRKTEVAGITGTVLSITGYTGAGGCEVYIPAAEAPVLWKAVFEAGGEFGIKPAGLGARDTLRLEMGYSLYGNDIDETTSPIEAGLGWITRFTEGNDFIDREIFLRQKEEGTERKLVGFILKERGIPRLHYEIADENGNIIGNVTSGTMSPMMKTGIGMGYVKTGCSAPGTRVNIIIRNKKVGAEIVKPPIYKENS